MSDPNSAQAPMTAGPTGADKIRANQIEALSKRPPATPAAPADKERNLQVPPSRMSERQFANLDHVVTIESNWTLNDVVKPIFWGSTWQKLKKYDKVSVRVDDDSWYAEVMVTQVGPGYAFVRVMTFVDFNQEAAPAPDGDEFDVRERGQHLKWCVIRKADNAVLKEKCGSKREAEDWLTEYRVQQAKAAALI